MKNRSAYIGYFIILMIISINGFSQQEPIYRDILIGDSIRTGKSLEVKDSSFYDPLLKPTIKHTYFINNILSLRINEDINSFLPDSFILSVKLKIIYVAQDSLVDSIPEKILSINYYKDRAYDNNAIFKFESARYVKAEILEISSNFVDTSLIIPFVVLDNRMVIERVYDMGCSDDAISSIQSDTITVATHGELKISWVPNNVSQFYDVEWTYIDKSALDNGRYSSGGFIDPFLLFKNNSTRVSTKTDTCMIPLLYDGEGYLFYRVRGAQIDQNGEVITTLWSSEVDTATANWKYYFSGHERNLNWQASTTFAEEGKRKSVVSYFDGSLRGRQVVTRDNTMHTTVVAETLFDKQGRPVIQVMPAPTLNTLISYNPYFNVRDMNSAEYDKSVYDTLSFTGEYCSTTADSMSVISGASNYYSSLNPLKEDRYNQYIPDANGYAFTQTQYTQDNSGRIFRQSGVGEEFKMGNNRETRYYYATPTQQELDILFGTEAGDASHYQKNIVRDANGQYSISYVDMHGRTIATALAGNAPEDMDTLKSYRTDSLETTQLLSKTNNVLFEEALKYTGTITMTSASIVDLHYSIGTTSLNIEDCKQENICYDCLYDLTITITGDCEGSIDTLKNSMVVTLSNFPLWSVDTTCSLAIPIDTTISVYLEEGTYNITKELSISKLGMDLYRDSVYLPGNTCKSYDSIYRAQMQLILETLDCSNDTLQTPYYLSYRDQMMADMIPLLGQYADTASLRSCFSIFDRNSGRYFYQWVADTGFYLNEHGERDSILNTNGNMVPPQDLTIDEFISNFKSGWALNLLSLHPEYCLLVQYERFGESHEWDEDFENTDTYQEAYTKGYLNPTGTVVGVPGSLFPVNQTDPLYSYGFATNAKFEIEDSLFHFRENTGNPDTPYVSAWGLAVAIAHCNEPISQSCINQWSHSSSISVLNNSLCAGEKDMAWRIFRSLYLAQKRQWIDNFIYDQCTAYPRPSFPCNPIFPERDSLLTASGYLPWEGEGNLISGQNEAENFYNGNCESYSAQWREQLGYCYTEAEKELIINHLIEVCKQGADQQHPYGSSTVKPGGNYIFKSFAEVFEHVNDSLGMADPTCNVYLINKPLPYEHSTLVVQLPGWGKPDSCTCNKINTLYLQYQENNALYEDFSDYISESMQTNISQHTLDTLMALCNDSTSCKFLAQPVMIPPALQCGIENICITCPEFLQAYNSFTTDYPTIVPTMEELDTVQQLHNRIFSNYLNNWFGFSLTTQEYLLFQSECDSFNIIPDTVFTCENLNNLINGFQTYYYNLTNNDAEVQRFDSNGCNVTHWTIRNNAGYDHDPSLKVIDFLHDGILRQAYNDTTKVGINFNYKNSFCVDSTFSMEARIRFQMDSVRKSIYVRNGGSNSLYGSLIFELFTNSSPLYLEKLYSVFTQSGIAGNYPAYIHYIYPPGGRTETEYKFSDSSMVIDLSEWKTFKVSHIQDTVKIYLDTILLKSIFNPYPVNKAGPFSIRGIGYDLEIDWVKFYGNDSLKMVEDFEDCDWAPHGFDTTCILECSKYFGDYVNYYLGTNMSLFEIQEHLNRCEVVADPCSYNGPLLCGRNEPLNEFVDIQPDGPCADSTNFAITMATQLYEIYMDSLIGEFNEAYTKKCLSVGSMESFTVTKPVSEYHHTLYYYDLAGNLVKTIPPEGVHPNRDLEWLSTLDEKRITGEKQVPEHTLATNYRYNSLNQVVSQGSPDGGRTEFWYDRLGRLVVSQNAKQRQEGKYSYTKYDVIGRIVEVAEKYQSTPMSQLIARDALSLKDWVEHGNNKTLFQPKMVTRTYYDAVSNLSSIYDGLTDFTQKSFTLRNRVSSVRYNNAFSWNATVVSGDTVFTCVDTYVNTAIEYSYDIHGNVDSMLNIAGIGSPMNYHGDDRFKMIAYKYDLISGKVNEVHYQPGRNDEFYHRYEYDADNRLTDVYTTDNKAFLGQQGLEEHEVRYQYYKHGPLARMIIGQQQVQGIDYAYTVQGWLKGVNSTSLNADYDMGGDGKAGGINSVVARDVYGFNLNYFTGDYEPINSGVIPFPGHSAYLPDDYKPLYNGNISSMAVNIGQFNEARLYNYGYDQLNRIVSMDTYTGLDQEANNWEHLEGSEDYRERISYDGNGNILQYLRRGYGTNINMDSLTYFYYPGSNQLRQVRDRINGSTSHSGNYTEDIDNQSNYTNYEYDEIGNLVEDDHANINEITWNVYGKISSIEKQPVNTGDATTISYMYDPNGNRVGKEVWRYGAPPIFTWYVRDAQGNVMAVYEKNQYPMSAGPLKLKEHHIYGSSRLGIIQRDLDMDSAKSNPVNEDLLGPTFVYQQQRGEKLYELSNHLGNVLVTISDKKVGPMAEDGTTEYYNADVVNANDYYPFGMLLPGRKYSAANLYRYGFNGYEGENEVKGEGNSLYFGERLYDPRIVRFLSIDRYAKKFPYATNYSFASNSPISAKDINGDSTYLVIYGAGYLNYTMAGGDHDVGNGFLLNALALKKKIESSSSFDPNRDKVVLVYAPTASRFIEATNKKYKSGKIAGMTVFSHGYGFSETNGTNTGGVSLGGEKPNEKRPDGTTVSQTDADAQKNNYDLREINGNTLSKIDKTNFESTAISTFYGCWIGGDQAWTDQQIKSYSLAQKLANHLGITIQAFTGSGLFKTDSKGKIIYDGTMIRATDAKSQKIRLSTFKPNSSPTIIRK